MKKIILSSLVALALGYTNTSAQEIKFYADENGQVFITPAKGRIELNIDPIQTIKACLV